MTDETTRSGPPRAYREFCQDFPDLATAWEHLRAAEEHGPLDRRIQRLIKLAVSIGTRSEGATHSAVRKALAEGATREEIRQVVALAASLVGMPASVAAWSWANDILRGDGER